MLNRKARPVIKIQKKAVIKIFLVSLALGALLGGATVGTHVAMHGIISLRQDILTYIIIIGLFVIVSFIGVILALVFSEGR